MKPTPVIRKEMYLNAMGAGGTIPVPSPYPRIEKYLYRLDGFDDKDLPEPVNRRERYLYWLCGGRDKWIDEPVTRIDKYMYYACGYEEYGYPTPVTREEQFWYDYIQAYIEIKTLTGTLPLSFRTSETALRSWTIYGNNTPHNYSAEGTLPLTFTSHTAGAASDWVIEGNNNVGKNLVNVESAGVNPRIVVNTLQNSTGTIWGSTSGGANYIAFSLVPSFEEGKTYTISFNNLYTENTASRVTIRRKDSYQIRYSTALTTYGKRSFSFPYTAAEFPNGAYISIILNGNTGAAGELHIENLMLVEGSTIPPTFEPYTVGVGERTENLYDYDNAEITDWIINASGQQQVTPEYRYRTQYITVIPSGVYTLIWAQAVQPGTSTPYIRICFFNSETFISRSVINGVTTVSKTVAITMPANCNKILVQCDDKTSKNGQYFVDIMLVEGSIAPESFIPYGYEVPLTISQTGQTDKTVDIYIGDTPLTEGETVSKTSTGVDLELFEGENTISTTLYNKPEMSIEGVDYVGVGAVSGDKYLIRVINSANISPYNPNAPESNTSYVYNDSTYTLDTDSQFKTALINWQSGNGNFTITKTKGSTFKLESLTFMGNWGGADHYIRANVITPTGTSYTGSTNGSHLLITYYDSEIDTLTPREIRESITVSASVHSSLTLPTLDAPLTEGETLTMEDVGHNFTTFAGVKNTIEPFNPEIYDYGEFDMSITYKGG